MHALIVVGRVVALVLVVSLVCGAGMLLEDRGETDAGTLVLGALLQGFLETVGMLLGG